MGLNGGVGLVIHGGGKQVRGYGSSMCMVLVVSAHYMYQLADRAESILVMGEIQE